MDFLPQLLAILAILLPSGRREMTNPIVPVPSEIQRSSEGAPEFDLILCPVHLPTESQSYYECLDETALDEEDTTRVENHAIIPLTFLDLETSPANALSSSFRPAIPHSRLLVSTPILRC
jgi:hypothetical protein